MQIIYALLLKITWLYFAIQILMFISWEKENLERIKTEILYLPLFHLNPDFHADFEKFLSSKFAIELESETVEAPSLSFPLIQRKYLYRRFQLVEIFQN